jgi:hypothetical protein
MLSRTGWYQSLQPLNLEPGGAGDGPVHPAEMIMMRRKRVTIEKITGAGRGRLLIYTLYPAGF